MSSSTVTTYVCDNCGKSESVDVLPNVRPEGWANLRLLERFTTDGIDACSPECAQALILQHADKVAREFFPKVEVPA